ncbi:MAG: hypothetical protein H0Z19_07300 [Archaeoglobus sp.]|uniref:hypothetical protein n=1 Tax=Archaeoglobus sp. TaxID=1872626 RepID=UPI001D377F21|nr:hypothetical protein [Archaeoglobus sp.]MBO8180270.1 hypothetical protein [Archaeoglobus sp.]
MVVEEIIAQYGIAGGALVLMFLMYKANLETMSKLSDALDRLNESFRDLKEEIRVMREEIIRGDR